MVAVRGEGSSVFYASCNCGPTGMPLGGCEHIFPSPEDQPSYIGVATAPLRMVSCIWRC
jgi:hypothetical protein